MIRDMLTSSVLILTLAYSAAGVGAQPLSATGAAERYNAAGELYQNGRFDEALGIYEELIDEGIENPDLYYNASNAAYRAGNLGLAVLNIERSLKLDPSDRDALENRAFLNSIKLDQEPANENIVFAFLERTYDRLNIHTAGLLSAILFTVVMLIAITWLYAGGKLRVVLLAGICLGAFSWFCTTGLFLHKLHRVATLDEAIVMNDEVNAYSGPGADNTHIFTIHEGTKVVIERSQGDWRLIRLNSGAGGWLAADALESVSVGD